MRKPVSFKIFSYKIKLALFLLVFSFSFSQVFFAQEKDSKNTDDDTQKVAALVELIKVECEKLEVTFPIPDKELINREYSSFAAEAVKNAIVKYTEKNVRVLISGKTVYVVMSLSKPSGKDEWMSPQIYKSAMKNYENRLNSLRKFEDILEKTLEKIFVSKVSLNYNISTDIFDGTKSLNADIIVSTRDIISDNNLNYRNLWSKLQKFLNDNGIALTDTSSRNDFSLVININPYEDKIWLYQSYQRIKLWDPYAESENDAGKFVAIEVVYAVRRRKECCSFGNPQISTGAAEYKLLKRIVSGLKTN